MAAGMKRKNPESSRINHEVFLSFRGKDTRKEFTDVLHKKLKIAGIEVFKDDEKLCAGEEIKQGLKDAIKRSRISIAIFSKNYASSKFCLMELEQMWKCRESNGQIIIPIFYDVRPYDVKNQTGDFEPSFKKHEADEKVDSKTIKKWKEVLLQVGQLSGFDRALINGGHVSDLLERVLKRVRQVLKKDDQVVTDKLVGIDLHVEEMMRKLGVVYSDSKAIQVYGEDVRVVGICGMLGVGKTTLAKVVFNKIHKLFDGCSFLEGINSEGVKVSQEVLIANLQKEKREPLSTSSDGIKILSSRFTNMKVLIVLDDVREVKQIKGLAEKVKWFSSGSRIIVTTNRKEVLKGFDFGEAGVAGEAEDKAAEEYEVKPMEDRDAFQLFRKHAPQGVFDSLSIDIVKAIGGIPFAIVLTALHLSANSNNKRIWEEALESFKDNKEEPVKAAFMASYESLDPNTKEIFLDIACFFIGKDERIPYYMWKACGYAPATAIKKLRDMHLLEIGENKELRMHSLLRDFGRKHVNDKCPRERCRFWNHSHALPIAEDFQGTSSVKGIGLTVEEGSTDCFKCEQFCNMSMLSYLRLDRAKIQGTTQDLPKNLRWLDWRECRSIPELCNMHSKELVILDLSRSEVNKDSEFWEQIAEKVEKLKVLNLQGCKKLHVSFDFPAPNNLEILILEDCTQLFQIGQFISNLENLSSLNLRNCSLVKELPQALYDMESLTELLIDGTDIRGIHCKEGSLKNLETLSARNCKRLKDISTIVCLRKLSSLDLDGADIDGLPRTFEFPQRLKRLSLRECQKLVELPPSIGKLDLLEVMDLSDTKITELPQSVEDLMNLKTLKMAHTFLQKFPKYIVNLENLEEIDFSLCKNLEGKICCYISGLSSLRILKLSSSDVAGLSNSICRLCRHLQFLDILKCDRLHTLPKLPSSLLSLRWGSNGMTVPNLSYLKNLKELCLNHDEQPEAGSSNQAPNIGWITRLTNLETLELSLPNVTNLPEDFSNLSQLRELTLSYMKELVLTQLPSSSSLWTLRLKHCKIQDPKFSGLNHLSELELKDCDLAEIEGLEDLTHLEVLIISPRSRIADLNGLRKLRRLRKVEVSPFDPASPILLALRARGCEVDACC